MKTKINRINKLLTLVIILLFTIVQISCKKDSTSTPVNPVTFSLIDYDGNVYDSIRIGTQVWMKQNLKVTHFHNGEAIPRKLSSNFYDAYSSAYCDYQDDTAISRTYGKLYNYYAVADSREICPPGWHVPTDAEWQTLITYLQGATIAGGKLKETGIMHWSTPNANATNETGFTALPAGVRDTGSDHNWGTWACFWVKSNSLLLTYSYKMYYTSGNIDNVPIDRSTGISVRCIKN